MWAERVDLYGRDRGIAELLVHVKRLTCSDRDDHECGGITAPGNPETDKLTVRSLPDLRRLCLSLASAP